MEIIPWTAEDHQTALQAILPALAEGQAQVHAAAGNNVVAFCTPWVCSPCIKGFKLCGRVCLSGPQTKIERC